MNALITYCALALQTAPTPPPYDSQLCQRNGNEQMHRTREGAALSNSYDNA